jgi:hypothetical protein
MPNTPNLHNGMCARCARRSCSHDNFKGSNGTCTQKIPLKCKLFTKYANLQYDSICEFYKQANGIKYIAYKKCCNCKYSNMEGNDV